MKNIIYSLIALLLICEFGCSSKKEISSNSKNIIGGHEYVDLGLPSGRLWATCNVGATKPTEYGDYFAWGETKPKETYIIENYKFVGKIEEDMDHHSYSHDFTKYCSDSTMGKVDNLSVLENADDAATVNWGKAWRMPTIDEQKELKDGCDWVWINEYDNTKVSGWLGTSQTNGNTIFLPATGTRDSRPEIVAPNEDGGYWSSSFAGSKDYKLSIYFCGSKTTNQAGFLHVNDQSMICHEYWRHYGHSVRAVVK